MTLSEYKSVPLQALRGAKPALTVSHIRKLEAGGFHSVSDVLTLLPRDFEDRKTLSGLAEARGEEAKAVSVRVFAHDYVGWGKSRTLKVYVRDTQSAATLLCFGRNFLAKQLPPGTDIYLWAKFSYYKQEWHASTFDFEIASAHPKRFFRIVPRYPLAGGLSAVVVRKSVESACNYVAPQLENDIPEDILKYRGLVPVPDALRALHFPSSMEEVDIARSSLAYRELFYTQLHIGLSQRRDAIQKAPIPDLSLQDSLIDSLPFTLTDDQRKVLGEINEDLRSAKPMFRILQGDVGCGKTLLAFLASLAVRARGQQTVFIAPTGLLARQHFENARVLLSGIDLSLGLLHGSLGTKERKEALAALQEGRTDLVIGTHALLSDAIRFKDLGLVVIDEQQRFGVAQRDRLVTQHETRPDVLVMTATPIPRTLVLSLLGHSDISTIHSMPPGRTKITTHLARMLGEEKVYAFVGKQLDEGFQAYFVCPRIEEDKNRQSTEALAELLAKRFEEHRIAVLHSRIDEEESFRIMQEFYAGDISILVATSVVEVGIDVAKATCMVVVHAELFGLSTLHQLRGRVGRSKYPSYAFLVYAEDLSDAARRRLKAMYESSDGFELAEEDLFIRGPGDIAGIRQSGYLKLEVADLRRDLALLQQSLHDTRELLKEDPGLLAPAARLIRKTLDIEASSKEVYA